DDLSSTGGGATFSGTWTLGSAEPPVAAGRGRGAGGGGIAGPYAETLFAQAPGAVAITQTADSVSVEIGGQVAEYTIDGETGATPPGDVMAVQTPAPRDRTPPAPQLQQ